MDIKSYAKKILELIEEIETYKNNKKNLAKKVADVEIKYRKKEISENQYKELIKEYLKGKTQKEVIKDYNNHILKSLNGINANVLQIYDSFIEPSSKEILKGPKKIFSRKSAKDDDVNVDEIKNFIAKQKAKKSGKAPKEGYSVYKASELGKIANYFFEELSMKLTKKYPEVFKSLLSSLKVSNIKILSKTYVSIVFFLTVVSFIVVCILSFVFLRGGVLFIILRAVFLSIAGGAIAFAGAYFYPINVIKNKRKNIKNELPFMIIHMSAVAGSGTPPINIFKLILDSEDYKELGGEIKEILNYVNLFGYNLSTALRSVAVVTPSPRFKELLNGIVSTIETGGNLKNFLNQKAEESLNTYRLERKKYVETLSTYSDVYTGVLIAAPLLFVVTLAIINVIGGSIGGLSVDFLAKVGVFGVIPFMNVAFLLVLDVMQPKE